MCIRLPFISLTPQTSDEAHSGWFLFSDDTAALSSSSAGAGLANGVVPAAAARRLTKGVGLLLGLIPPFLGPGLR